MDGRTAERPKLRLWLGFVFVVSILLLVFLHEPLQSSWWGQFITRAIDAVAVATIIGFALEEALLREFGREVFLASVGYVLPEELRPEMRWICHLNEMCVRDVMVCKLTPIGNSVILHFHRTQVVKNIGHNKVDLKLGLGIDEWFRDEKQSRIIKFSYVSEDQSGAHAGKAKKSPSGLNLPDEHVVSLEKGKEVTITSEFEEVYSKNGYFFMHIKYPTSGLIITVDCPDDSGLGLYVNFANREGRKAQSIGNDFVCPFTLLPYQRVAVRFWEKAKSEAWMKESN